MTGTPGMVAAGHACTSAAARELLEAGGNAFDAALGALCAATVCEPLLTSLGGGGFLMARTADGSSRLYDFFAQTPARRLPAEALDFYPILAHFGTATQEFHIGMGSIAVPGVVAGLFEVQRRHCRMHMRDIVAPAVRLAREGVEINPLQTYITSVLREILQQSPAAVRLVASSAAPDRFAESGEFVDNPDLAATLEALAEEGPDLFYRGELAARLAADCATSGGMLTREDLADYRVQERRPIRLEALGAHFDFNPPPSPGGSLLAFALGLLDTADLDSAGWGSERHCRAVVSAMAAASRLRRQEGIDHGLDFAGAEALLTPERLAEWRATAMPGDLFSRGTTHISVVDGEGNVASLTSSNGEGCAYVLPGTGIMLNNMLGEQDLNPEGFHRWREGSRLASMMCPSIACFEDGTLLALGSGGSNRIRGAVLQVLVNLLRFGMAIDAAVNAPRMHLEGNRLSIEKGYPESGLAPLLDEWPDHQVWPEPNIFFGGVHAVARLADGRFRGAGDPRRGGVVALSE